MWCYSQALKPAWCLIQKVKINSCTENDVHEWIFPKERLYWFNRITETSFWNGLQCRKLIWLMAFINETHTCLKVVCVERNNSCIRVLYLGTGSLSAGTDFLCLFWTLQIQYHVCKSLWLTHNMSQGYWVHILTLFS